MWDGVMQGCKCRPLLGCFRKPQEDPKARAERWRDRRKEEGMEEAERKFCRLGGLWQEAPRARGSEPRPPTGKGRGEKSTTLETTPTRA